VAASFCDNALTGGRMRLNVGVLSAAVVLTCAPFSIAEPLFPCPTAVNSVHGNAIAIAHNTTEWHTGSGKLLSVQFTVMTKMNFVNDSQKTSAPVIYWGDWPWAVVLDMNNQADRSFSSCAVPFVTDDPSFSFCWRLVMQIWAQETKSAYANSQSHICRTISLLQSCK